MDAQEKWLKAIELLDSNPTESELKKIVELVQDAVADNHGGAYFTLYFLYNEGYGVEQDKNKSYELLCKSLELGYERAKLMLARLYVEGEVVEKDLAKAERYLRELAEKDDKDACAYLANYIFNNVFPNSSQEEGLSLLEKAAKLGHPNSMGQLGEILGNYCRDEESNFWFEKAKEVGLQGVDEAQSRYTSETYPKRRIELIRYYISTKEFSKVIELLERDYNNGDKSALYLQAELLLKGMGEERFGQDIPRAISIYESLSEKGDAQADYHLGEAYLNGPLEQNTEKGIYYYTKSAEAGDADAQFVLGDIYRRPMNDMGNKEMAAHWIELAANQDQRDALCVMAYSYLQDPEIETMNVNNLSYDQDVDKGMQFLRHAADLGNANALYVLAICYQKGKYVEKDEKKAFELLWTSIQAENTPESIKKLGDFYRDGIGAAQAYEDAARLYQAASDRGNAAAMIALSELYNEGKGVEKNPEIAIQLQKKAGEIYDWNLFGKMPLEIAKEQAKQGDQEAMWQLGQRYLDGDGVEQNIEVASDWWLKAAMKGHVPASHDLGIYYYFTKHDIDNGLKWLKISASADYARSLHVLGDIYINGWGVEPDTDKGLEYLTKAAEQNHEESQLRLAGLYHDGVSVDQNFEKARYWFEKYVEHDDAQAHYRMGRCLYEGDMYDVNYPNALEHFTTAVKGNCHEASPYYIDMLWRGNHAEQDREAVLATYKELDESGDAIASFYLYTLYNDEEYTSRDKDTAIAYLKKSAEEGYPVALRYLAFQYMEGGLLETDFNKANDYFIQASDRGDAIAMVNLATSYQSGRGVEKDVKKALEFYISAAESGESYAACEAAKILLTGEDGLVETNYYKAVELLQKYADNGDPESCFLIAYAMFAKSDMENSYSWELVEKAFGYMLHAAKNEHPEAMYYVACSFMEGRGVIIDMEQAKHWFDETLRKDHRTEEIKKKLDLHFSDYEQAALYPRYIYWHDITEHNPALLQEKEPLLDEDGSLIPIAALKGAAQCGDVNAALLYGQLLLKDNPEEAKKFLTAVIKQGYSDIADAVGKQYYTGKNVEQDLDKAVEYFNLGLEAGNIRCALSLGLMYTADGVSKETEDYGKNLLQSVCEVTDENSEEYKYAKAQLERIEQREQQSMSKLTKGFRSLFGKK